MRTATDIRALIDRNPKADAAKVQAALEIIQTAGYGRVGGYALSLPYANPVVRSERGTDDDPRHVALSASATGQPHRR
ncbi:MAG: hypothetical protein FJX72_01595 [Armatimonadetes bacterium]|nr:hypothetical protein [Armatimonadota bacterium]